MKETFRFLPMLAAFAGFGSMVTSCGEPEIKLTAQQESYVDSLSNVVEKEMVKMEQCMHVSASNVRHRGNTYFDNLATEVAMTETFMKALKEFNQKNKGIFALCVPGGLTESRVRAFTMIDGKEVFLYPRRHVQNYNNIGEKVASEDMKEVTDSINAIAGDISLAQAQVRFFGSKRTLLYAEDIGLDKVSEHSETYKQNLKMLTEHKSIVLAEVKDLYDHLKKGIDPKHPLIELNFANHSMPRYFYGTIGASMHYKGDTLIIR